MLLDKMLNVNMESLLMPKLFLSIQETKEGATLQVLKQRYFRENFYKGKVRFKASNGFIIESAHNRLQVGIRLSHLFVSAVPNSDTTEVFVPYNCGMNRTFIRDMKQAISEYNEG